MVSSTLDLLLSSSRWTSPAANMHSKPLQHFSPSTNQVLFQWILGRSKERIFFEENQRFLGFNILIVKNSNYILIPPLKIRRPNREFNRLKCEENVKKGHSEFLIKTSEQICFASSVSKRISIKKMFFRICVKHFFLIWVKSFFIGMC